MLHNPQRYTKVPEFLRASRDEESRPSRPPLRPSKSIALQARRKSVDRLDRREY